MSKQPVKWFRCACGCQRLVKSRSANSDSYQPVLFRLPRWYRTRTELGKIYSKPIKFVNGVNDPLLKQHGYYCPACWTFWGATFAEVRKKVPRIAKKKITSAAQKKAGSEIKHSLAVGGEEVFNEAAAKRSGLLLRIDMQMARSIDKLIELMSDVNTELFIKPHRDELLQLNSLLSSVLAD